jgi:hypothetical protein
MMKKVIVSDSSNPLVLLMLLIWRDESHSFKIYFPDKQFIYSGLGLQRHLSCYLLTQ